MCRLTAYVGPPILPSHLVTRPNRSIIKQSFSARERITEHGYLNGDGYGLGWYPMPTPQVFTPTLSEERPCVFTSTGPAWSSENLKLIAESIVSPVVFAHVRAATEGTSVDLGSCHPFRYGRFMFMHNGNVGAFSTVRRRLLKTLKDDIFDYAASRGSSDSAFCFALFLNQLDRYDMPLAPDDMRQKLDNVISILDKAADEEGIDVPSMLNFVLTDGYTLVATRYIRDPRHTMSGAATLYFASGTGYHCVDAAKGSYRMFHTDRRNCLVIITSEPLTADPTDWVPVPTNHMLVVTFDAHLLISPIFRGNIVPEPNISTSLKELAGRFLDNAAEDVQVHPAINAAVEAAAVHDPREDRKDLQALRSASLISPVTAPHDASSKPELLMPARHILPGHTDTVLCQATYDSFVYSGSQDTTIRVWNHRNYNLVHTMTGHSGSVLALETKAPVSGAEALLFSSSSDCTLRLWRATGDFAALVVLSFLGMGDILSVTHNDTWLCLGFMDTRVRTIKMKKLLDLARHAAVNGEVKWASAASDEADHGLPGSQPTSPSFLLSPRRSNAVAHVTAPDLQLSASNTSTAMTSAAGSGVGTGAGSGPAPRPPVPPAAGDDELWVPPELRRSSTQLHWTPFKAVVELPSTRAVPPPAEGQGHSKPLGSDSTLSAHDLGLPQSPSLPTRMAKSKAATPSTPAALNSSTLSVESDARSTNHPHHSHHILSSLSCDAGFVGHFGYVFASTICCNKLITGAGDGMLKVWDLKSLNCTATLVGHQGSVLALCAIQSTCTVYSGARDRTIRTWDVETLCERKLTVSFEAEVLAIDADLHHLYSGFANGDIIVFKAENLCRLHMFRKGGPPVQSLRVDIPSGLVFVGCAQDVMLWNALTVEESKTSASPAKPLVFAFPEEASQRREMHETDLMMDHLRKFIAIPSVSGHADQTNACYDAAKFLVNLLKEHGCDEANLVPIAGCNPLVMGRIMINPAYVTILIYGHYDVMPAENPGWLTDPWELVAKGGYLYGRGVTDDKGPIIATLAAVQQLRQSGELKVNIVFLYEGEAENHSVGFFDTVNRLLDYPNAAAGFLPHVDLIFITNNYWIGEDHPCLTYSMRGLIKLQVTIKGPSTNLHSGVDGGAVVEPAVDLCKLVASLTDSSGRVVVPDFHANVLPLSDIEKKLFEKIDFSSTDYLTSLGISRAVASSGEELLSVRWRQPSLTVSSVETSNEGGSYSIIPSAASAKISVRYVPKQKPGDVQSTIEAHLQHEFKKLNSPNSLEVTCIQSSPWWLGDISGPFYEAASRAIEEVWQQQPLMVGEGGTMNTTSFLVTHLKAPAMHLPMGQSSDRAHLDNERIRLLNLQRGKDVVAALFRNIASAGLSTKASA